MKKKHLLLPVVSGLLLSPLVLSQQVLANTNPDTNSSQEAAVSTEEALLPVTATSEAAATQDLVETVILHTNDVHGRILEERGVIGDAKAAAVIAMERQKVANTIVVDAGDAFQGLPISNSTQGEDRARIMNEIGYDAMAVGNHEFDFGLEQAKKYKEILNFPLLSANTYVNDVRLFESHTIVDKDTTIVGDEFVVIGVTTPETSTKTHPKNVEGVIFADPVTEVNKVIAEVEARALADKRVYQNYIVLAHLGVDTTTPLEWRGSTLAQALADNTQLKGKRVIVIDGHSHSVESATYGDNVTYSQIGSYHNNIGKITLKSNQLLAETGLIAAADTKTIAADEKIAALVADIKTRYEAENAVVVIENSPVELNGDRSNVRVRETNLGNLIADSIYHYGQTGGFSHKTNLAVTNGGGIRATIAKDKPVTKGDIIAVLPFGNIVSQITVTGQQLADMFAKSLSAPLQADKETQVPLLDANGFPLLDANGGFLHISGAKVIYDTRQPVGERIVAISILDPETQTYQLLNPEKIYYLATNDFIAAGGDGYTMLGGAREEGPSMDSVFAAFLKVAKLTDYATINSNDRLVVQDAESYAKELAAAETSQAQQVTKKGKSVVAEEAPQAPQLLAVSTPVTALSLQPPATVSGSKTEGKNVQKVEMVSNKQATVSPTELTQIASTISHATPANLPKTASHTGWTTSLLGLAMAGLGLAVRRRRD